jgi:arginine utilization regulatory protein
MLFGCGKQPGYLELADGGTLFLDEAERLPAAAQEQLYHFCVTGEFTRMEGTRTRHATVKLIVGSARGRSTAGRAQKLHKDLAALLAGSKIVLPPGWSRVGPRDRCPLTDCTWETPSPRASEDPCRGTVEG